MKIAVAYDNENIFQHFGKTESFKIYETKEKAMIHSEVVSTNGFGHSALVDFLKERNVETLICGGIGAGAQDALNNAGIKLYGGCSGNADEAVEQLLNGTLQFDSNVKCSHHDGEHEGTIHICGRHGCGKH